MSAPDPVSDGTLDLLDHLPPKPRALYVEKLSKEEVVAIVLAVWKERDATRIQVLDQSSVVKAAASRPSSNEPHSKERSPHLFSRAPHPEGKLSQRLRDTNSSSQSEQEQSTMTRKRRHSPEVEGLAEKARKLSIEPRCASGLATDRIAAFDLFDHTGTSAADSIEIPDHDDPNRDIEDEHLVASARELADSASAQTLSDSHEKQRLKWEDLHVVLQVPGKPNEEPVLCSIGDAPEAVRRKIHLQWDGVRKFATYKLKLDAMLKYYRKHLGLTTCLRTHVIPTVQKKKGIFNDGGVSKETACDQCIRNHVPCTYLIELAGHPTLCVVPLPTGLRIGKESKDVAFWVMPSWKK